MENVLSRKSSYTHALTIGIKLEIKSTIALLLHSSNFHRVWKCLRFL
jgi:hypothetical protein